MKEVEIYILNIINALKYGSVTITVHNGEIVQIEKTEKTRFDSSKKNP
jgi:hypothetical protein